MNVYVIMEFEHSNRTGIENLRNLEVFGTAKLAAEAVRRFDWAEQTALAIEWDAISPGVAHGVISPDKKTLLQVSINKVEGALLS